jgi:hypothetical protein
MKSIEIGSCSPQYFRNALKSDLVDFFSEVSLNIEGDDKSHRMIVRSITMSETDRHGKS